MNADATEAIRQIEYHLRALDEVRKAIESQDPDRCRAMLAQLPEWQIPHRAAAALRVCARGAP